MADGRRRWLVAAGACLGLLLVPLIALIWLGAPPPPPAPLAPVVRPSPRPRAPLPTADDADGARLIVGTVSGASDAPIGGAEIGVAGMEQLKSYSDARGSYQLQALPLVELVLVVRANGHAEARVTVAAGEAGSEQRVDVVLVPAEGVAGVVVNPSGEPVSGANVGCADRPDDRMLAAVSDAQGHFELPDRAAGCRGVARHQLYGDAAQTILRAGDDNRLALSEPASISGVVVDEHNAPVTTFVVAIESFRGKDDSESLKRGYRKGFNDSEGRFTVPDLQAGSYVLSASTRGRPPEQTNTIEVASGEQARGVRIVLGRGGVLQGTVSDDHGEPISRARVEIDAHGVNGFLATTCGVDGSYRLEGVPTEPFSIRVSAVGYTARIVSIVSTSTGTVTRQDVHLSPGSEGEGKTEYTGIGASLGSSPEGVVVGQVFKDGPAERAGLRQRDLIVSVDGVRAHTWTVPEAVQRLRGPADTSVSVRIRRDGSERDLSIVRERFVR